MKQRDEALLWFVFGSFSQYEDRQIKWHQITHLEIQQLVEDVPGEPGDGVGIKGETRGGIDTLYNKSKSLISSF